MHRSFSIEAGYAAHEHRLLSSTRENNLRVNSWLEEPTRSSSLGCVVVVGVQYVPTVHKSGDGCADESG